MSTRPYQVDDRVMVRCTDGKMRPGTVDQFEVFPSHPDEATMWVRLDTPYHHNDTELVLGHVWVSGDHTTVTGPFLLGAHCELIAPTNPSGGAVTSTPAPSGAPSLVELDRSESEQRVLSTALAWHACFPDGDADDLRDAFWAMKNAIADYAKAVSR